MSIILGAALLPPLFLMWKVYQNDTIEKEPTGLLVKIFVFGMISTIPAVILETIGQTVLEGVLGIPQGRVFNLLMFFIVVAGAEELVKYFAMKLPTWRNENFNYVFDGVVYGVAAALGFAALENVLYVLDGGLATAGMRALTSIPIHCICGVYMGHYYGMSRFYAVRGKEIQSRRNQKLSLWVPVLIHGLYDFAAVAGSPAMEAGFLAFIVILDIIAISAVRRFARNDQPA
jgi:RsiW-degrading membrane proteinase PrsW (M82 family)